MEQPPMDYGNYSGGYGGYGGEEQVVSTSTVTENNHWWQADTQVETTTCKF